MPSVPSELYRDLPSVESVRLDPGLRDWSEKIRSEFVVWVIRRTLEESRAAIERAAQAPNRADIVRIVQKRLAELVQPSLRRVINATGVVLHTGLGRAPLAPEVCKAVLDSARYCNVEFDLITGERSQRQSHVESLLCALSGAEAAMIVNNNAAALYLVLNALGFGKEVIVSRGQLIEIGGSFRLPEIMKRAGVKLVEVGTTNRTRIEDYQAAITAKTTLLLRACPSNYRIAGFTESVTISELVELGRAKSLTVVDDLGGGLMWDWTTLGLPYEPTVRESIDSGADIVLVSGDKALGGPQCGIVLGKRALVGNLQRSPLARVLRPDKLILAALSETLRLYLRPVGPEATVPSWQMLSEPTESVAARCATICEQLRPLCDWQILDIRRCESQTGSGTLPAVGIESRAVVMLPRGRGAAQWARQLRVTEIPVVSTIRDELVWLDLRTVAPDEMSLLIESITQALEN